MKSAPLILVEGRQAVLLPDEFRLEGSEVYVRRDLLTGDVVLSSGPASWESFFEAAGAVDVPADFMSDLEKPPLTGAPFENWIEPSTTIKTGGPTSKNEKRPAAPRYANVLLALDHFRQTTEFEQLQRSVDEERLSFDEAVQQIIEAVLSHASNAAKAGS